MKYNGIELKEFTSDKPVVFDHPRKMLVWDNEEWKRPDAVDVYAFMPAWRYPVATANQTFAHCAEIPEEPEPRRATNRELAKWLVMRNGECLNRTSHIVHHEYSYADGESDYECSGIYLIRTWEDDEWHEPTADYMGLEG